MYWLKRNAFIIMGVVLLLGGILVVAGKWQEARDHKAATENKIDSQWEDVQTGEKKPEPVVSTNVEIAKPNQARTKITDEMVGVIRSDVIGLKEPIYTGASELNMRRGVATVEAGELLSEHTVAIAGHRSQTRYKYFSEILRLKKGNEIIIETKDANGKKVETVYVVGKSYQVKPTDTAALEADVSQPRTLLLVTCDQWNSKTKTYDKRWITEAYLK